MALLHGEPVNVVDHYAFAAASRHIAGVTADAVAVRTVTVTDTLKCGIANSS